MSDELGKLEHLEDLRLDLQYCYLNINLILSPSHVLDLRRLSKLRKLRIPATYFMPAQDDEEDFHMCSPGHVFPSSLESLTLWANGASDLPMRWKVERPFFRDAVDQFLATLSDLSGPDAVFSDVREVSYRYGTGYPHPPPLPPPCACRNDVLCGHHRVLKTLGLTPSQCEDEVMTFHTKGVHFTSEPEDMTWQFS